MAILGELLEVGKLTPVVDRDYPLDYVCEAMRYLQEGRALGRIFLVP